MSTGSGSWRARVAEASDSELSDTDLLSLERVRLLKNDMTESFRVRAPLGGFYADLARLSFRSLGQSEGEDAMLQRGGDFVRVHARRQLEALGKTHGATFAAMLGITLRYFHLTFTAEGDGISSDADLEVLLGQAWNVGAH